MKKQTALEKTAANYAIKTCAKKDYWPVAECDFKSGAKWLERRLNAMAALTLGPTGCTVVKRLIEEAMK